MFITFEGGEGTGKTTLIKNVYDTLKRDFDIIKTREPGGSLVAEAIRDVVLNPKYEGVTLYTESLLFAAARAQHLDEVILPALKANKIVLCDRYIDSSLAYQAYARNLGFDFVLSINKYATDNMPNLTFYIDLDPKIGMQRIHARAHLDRLDQETTDFHLKVREGYLKVAERFKERIIVIDGSQSIEALTQTIIEHILKKL